MKFKNMILPEFMTEYVPAEYEHCFFPIFFRDYCLTSEPKFVKLFPTKRSECMYCYFFLKPQDNKKAFVEMVKRWWSERGRFS